MVSAEIPSQATTKLMVCVTALPFFNTHEPILVLTHGYQHFPPVRPNKFPQLAPTTGWMPSCTLSSNPGSPISPSPFSVHHSALHPTISSFTTKRGVPCSAPPPSVPLIYPSPVQPFTCVSPFMGNTFNEITITTGSQTSHTQFHLKHEHSRIKKKVRLVQYIKCCNGVSDSQWS